MRAAQLLVALLLACALAETASAAVSRGEFIRRGDALCTQIKRELAPLRARAEAAKTLPVSQQLAAAADIWAQQIGIQKRFVRRFHAIGVPRNDRRARQLVAAMDRGVVLAVRVQRAFATRDAAALPAALRAYITFTVSLNSRVVAYGFRVCGT